MNEKNQPLRGFVPPHALTDGAPDASVIVAFSGGPDSRTLLDLLVTDAKQRGYALYAAHVNHGIRGEEADRDEAFCREVAALYDIPIFVLRADVPALAAKSGESIETAARNVRYAYFFRIMQEKDIPILVTAHNADDNLETVLFDLVRGCGLDGLCGIPPIRPIAGGTLLRPLLSCRRTDILAYCEANALRFVTDSTNTDTQYTRNRIRAELIPALTAINPSALDSVTRTCKTLRADAEHLREETDAFIATHRRDFSLPLCPLCEAPTAIASRALMLLFRELTEGVALEQCHVEALLALAKRAVPHSSLDLPNGRQAVIEDGRLCLLAKKPTPHAVEDYCVPLTVGRNHISQTNCEIIIGNSQSEINVYKKATRTYFASDKIVGNLIARNRRANDTILCLGVHKDVRKLMSERRIPLELRSRLPVICDDEGILAIPFVAVRDGAYLPKDRIDPLRDLSLDFYIYE